MSKVLLVLGLLCMVVLSNAETLKIGESSDWEVVSDGQSKIEFKQGKKQLKAIVALKQDGGWIILKKVFKKDFSPNTILSFKIKVDADFDLETNFVKTDGSVHNKRGSLKDKYKEWTEVKVPLNSIKRGWKVKRHPAAGSEIQFGFSGKGKGFVCLSDFKIIGTEAWNSVKDWRIISDGESTSKLSQGNESTIKVDFALSGDHGWVLMEHSLKNKADQNRPVTFEIKTAFSGELEVKFIDKDGQVHCRKIRMGKNPDKWQEITIYKRDCDMKWKIGAQKSAQLQIGFSGNGKGTALLRNIGFGSKGSKATSKSYLDPNRKLAGIGFKQRRDKKIIPEDNLIFEWMKANQDTATPGKALLSSMEDKQGSTFNNALAVMAFVLKGEKLRAERILNIFSNAMNKDNKDTEIQNFYVNGKARGFFQYVDLGKTAQKNYVRQGACDRWMGDMAWLLLATKYYEKAYSSKRYNKLSKALLELLTSWFVDLDAEGGYVAHGWRKGDKYLHEKFGHLEGNIDAYAAFKACGKNKYALKIKTWLSKQLKDKKDLPLDTYTWRVLAFGDECIKLLDIPEFSFKYRKYVNTGKAETVGFYPFPAEKADNIWLDGNGHMACGYLTSGDIERGYFYANQYDRMKLKKVINGKTVHALPYALKKEGIYNWVDPAKGALSPAAWYIFAKNSFNPFTLKTGRQLMKITASTGDGDYLPRFACDGDMKTRWTSGIGDVEWLQIEFPQEKYLSGMTIFWETAYSQKYDILTSADGKKWRKVSSTEDGDGSSDKIYFKGHFVHFLRIATRKRGTGWGNSIWDIQLQGKEQEPIVKVSSAQENHPSANVIDGNKKTFWKSNGKAQEFCELDLTAAQGIGGVVLRWGKNFPESYVIESSLDGKKWTKAAAREVTNGSTDIVYFSPVNLRFLRLVCRQAAGKTIELNEIELKRDDEAASPLRLYKAVAQEYPEGYFPKWLYAKQEYWTVVGVEKGIEESLVSENATIEPFIKGFTLMPYIYMNKKLITAPQCKVRQGLINDYYPMPFITWEKNNAELKTNVWSTGTAENAATYAVYTIKNTGNKAISGKFYLAIRPIQLTPLWQHGGMSSIKNISFDNKKGAIKVNDKNALYVLNKQISFGAAKSPENDVITYMDKGKLPADTALQDNSGLISGALEIEFTIAPGQEKKVYALMPLTAGFNVQSITSKSFDKAFKSTCDYWNKKLNKTKINIPQKELVNVLKANLAYLLINADKNSLHPGSRAYDRSWIRDGSIMCQALLDTRNFSEVKKYLEWVASCQMENGRIPCMLELNGKMPGWAGGWCEWDGQGAYVFAVTSYYRFTKDKEFLKKMFPSVIKALKFLKQLRAQRLTAQYKGTVYYGIIPKSNSHEGYFPAQHSLWDDFWALKGWKDGQMLAAAAGQKEQIPWMKKEELGLRKNLLRNIKLLQKKTGIKNIPGCFEKADFDATSTAIAIWPAFETQYLPKESLDYTLDTYYQNTLMPRYTKLTSSYTPYELRTANAYLTMGKKKKLLSMINYFLRDMRPRKWLNWGEVVHADPDTPSYIGDMPHTWIGAIAINVIRNMFVYEHNNIDLIFAAGVDPTWLKAPQGISVLNFPTYFGEVGFKMKRSGNIIKTTFFGSVKGVRNILLTSPLARPIKSATVSGSPAKIINNKVVIEKFPAKVIIKY
jgi:F5/8 type C domain/Amylo-alpha-1,6-glucosidase